MFNTLENADIIVIGQKIKVRITDYKGRSTAEPDFVANDRMVGYSSVRIYQIPENFPYRIGDELWGNVKSFSSAVTHSRDGRKKIFINLTKLRRAYSFQTLNDPHEFTVTLRCGDNILKRRAFPQTQLKVNHIHTAPHLVPGSSVRIGLPQIDSLYTDPLIDGKPSIRFYQVLSDKFREGEVIKAEVHSIETLPGLAMGKRKKIVIRLCDPRRVYYYRLDPSSRNQLLIKLFCGNWLLKTKEIPLKREEFEAILGDKVYHVTKLIFQNTGKNFRINTWFKGSVENLVKQRFSDLKSVLPKAGPEHIRRLRKSLSELPQLEDKKPYDYFTEIKKHRTHERQLI